MATSISLYLVISIQARPFSCHSDCGNCVMVTHHQKQVYLLSATWHLPSILARACRQWQYNACLDRPLTSLHVSISTLLRCSKCNISHARNEYRIGFQQTACKLHHAAASLQMFETFKGFVSDAAAFGLLIINGQEATEHGSGKSNAGAVVLS